MREHLWTKEFRRLMAESEYRVMQTRILLRALTQYHTDSITVNRSRALVQESLDILARVSPRRLGPRG